MNFAGRAHSISNFEIRAKHCRDGSSRPGPGYASGFGDDGFLTVLLWNGSKRRAAPTLTDQAGIFA